MEHSKLYGTLLVARGTATHAVCPLCGKSSSLRSFPSGDGADIVLQSFRGMGRGKGFAVESRSSGLEDRHLCLTLKPKVVNLLSTLADRGYVAPEDLVRVVKPLQVRLSTPEELRELESLRHSSETLEAELKLEKASRDMLVREISELRTQAERNRRTKEGAEIRAAQLAEKLEQSRKAWSRLVSAYRESILSLRKLQHELEDTEYSENTVLHVTRNIEQMVQLVQELRTLSILRASARSDLAQAR